MVLYKGTDLRVRSEWNVPMSSNTEESVYHETRISNLAFVTTST